jgi:hypothetical protein
MHQREVVRQVVLLLFVFLFWTWDRAGRARGNSRIRWPVDDAGVAVGREDGP